MNKYIRVSLIVFIVLSLMGCMSFLPHEGILSWENIPIYWVCAFAGMGAGSLCADIWKN